jgi:tetratricopeptide (TPR) repeat protein
MSKEDLTPKAEAAPQEESAKDAPVEEAASVEEVKSEESIGEALGEDTPKEESKESEDKTKPTVGLDKLMKEKKRRKEAEKRAEELQKLIDEDDDDDSDDDPDDSDVQHDSSNVDERLNKLEREKQQKEREEKFDKLWEKTLEANPEFKEIADKEIIQQLAYNPKNSQKTLSQILEKAYGNLLQGRPSIETDVPASDPEPGKVDVEKAQTDSAYFKKVMADPKLKEEYNKGLTDRLAANL